METHELTELQYSSNVKGSLAIYVYDASGYHRGPQYFRRVVRYPGEEITVAQAHAVADKALSEKREVRITDSGDMLVFHSKDGQVRFPDNPARFWDECG
jgi:hypothetical protein